MISAFESKSLFKRSCTGNISSSCRNNIAKSFFRKLNENLVQMSTLLSTWVFAAVSWSKLSMLKAASTQALLVRFKISSMTLNILSPRITSHQILRDVFIVLSNNFDGIILTIQLNILVIAEEFETLAIDPRSRHSLVAYLGGRSFKFGSKRHIFWSKYRCVLPFSVQAGNGLLQLPYWSAQQIELKCCLNQWWDEKYFPMLSISAEKIGANWFF